MLKQKQLEAIDLLIAGDHTKADISKICDIGERTLYNWLGNDEFKAEWHKRADEFKSNVKGEAQAYMLNKVSQAMKNIVDLANNGESEKIKFDANVWIYESQLGKPTTKIETTEIQDDKGDNEDIDSMIESLKKENNVISLDDIKSNNDDKAILN